MMLDRRLPAVIQEIPLCDFMAYRHQHINLIFIYNSQL
jgi:hypothetical protein